MDVWRPSSGSSVPPRRDLSNKEDFLPVASSGSSVTARRVREIMSDDLRLAASCGVVGVDPTARGLGKALPFRIVFLRSSNLDNARLGLVSGFGNVCSMLALALLEWPLKVLLMVGVEGPSTD